jgi:hypothetical protein
VLQLASKSRAVAFVRELSEFLGSEVERAGRIYKAESQSRSEHGTKRPSPTMFDHIEM